MVKKVRMIDLSSNFEEYTKFGLPKKELLDD